jgi:hypothetical protein
MPLANKTPSTWENLRLIIVAISPIVLLGTMRIVTIVVVVVVVIVVILLGMIILIVGIRVGGIVAVVPAVAVAIVVILLLGRVPRHLGKEYLSMQECQTLKRPISYKEGHTRGYQPDHCIMETLM